MPDSPNKLSQFWQELKRRKVFRVLALYAATAFVILEVVDIITPALSLPSWTVTLVVVLLAIGFPIAAIFSWIFDITPEGLIKTKPTKDEANKGISQKPISRIFNLNNMVVAILLIVICILLYPKIFKHEQLDISKYPIVKSIAVLPLLNVNEDDKLEYFSDGVTQEIIDELAKVLQFQVSAFSSTVIYKGTKKPPKEIAIELGVSFILSGTSRLYSDSVRLSIELVNPETGNRIWGKQYDDVLTNAITIQNDIAKQVVAGLNIELSPEEKIGLDKVNTNSHKAFDLFLQAKTEYTKLTKAGFSKSINMLERAIELDPNYAQAYRLLAWIYTLIGNPEIIGDTDNATIIADKAQVFIDKAISLDPLVSDNYLIMGAIDLFYLNNLPGALQNVNKALEMSAWPKVPTNYCICVVIATYAAIGKFEEATEILELSKKIDRSNPFVFSDEGIVSVLKGKYDQAIYSFKQAVAFQDIPGFNFYLGWAYYHQRKYENSLRYLEKSIKGEAEPLALALAFLSNIYFQLGDIEKSEHYRNIILQQQSSGMSNLNIPLAMISAARINTDEALYFLEKAYEEKEFGFAYYVNSDPVFDSLKNNTAFLDLISRIGFVQK